MQKCIILFFIVSIVAINGTAQKADTSVIKAVQVDTPVIKAIQKEYKPEIFTSGFIDVFIIS